MVDKFLLRDVRVRVAASVTSAIIISILGVRYWPDLVQRSEYANTSEALNTGPVSLPRQTAAVDQPGEPRFVEPPASLRHNADGTVRDFVKLTPDRLSALFRDKTENQLRAAVTPYQTKWAAISGIVENVYTDDDAVIAKKAVVVPPHGSLRYTLVSLRPWKNSFGSQVDVSLAFETHKNDAVELLRIGDHINAVCHVEAWLMQWNSLSLNDCKAFVK